MPFVFATASLASSIAKFELCAECGLGGATLAAHGRWSSPVYIERVSGKPQNPLAGSLFLMPEAEGNCIQS
jgi:hypothetical protein